MAEEAAQTEEGKMDAGFLRISAEVRRLERGALPRGARTFPTGAVFEQFDVEKISTDSYEAALESVRGIESRGVKGKKVEKVEKEERKWEERILSEEELQRIPREKIEVVARSEQEILNEEKKLVEMKDKFAKLISEIPKEEPKKKMVLEEAAVKAEEKPAVEEGKAEEIKELSENFKKIMVKKEEREKRERIRKMKREIEDMLDGG
jgi:hypothetical protein